MVGLVSRMKSRLVTDKDIEFLLAKAQTVFTPEMHEMMKRFDVNPERTIRLSFLASKCSERRKELGWDLQTAAGKVGVPRYRIREIESGSHSDSSQKEIRLYVKALGIEEWFRRWRKMNHDAFSSIREEPDRSTPWAKKVRGTNA